MRADLQIKRLQSLRAPKSTDLSIQNLVADTARSTQRMHRKLGELIELWQNVIPPALVELTTINSFRGGILQVTAENSSAAYELDRTLRSGALAELRRQFSGSLTRVKVINATPSKS
jgi:hypothetical protein